MGSGWRHHLQSRNGVGGGPSSTRGAPAVHLPRGWCPPRLRMNQANQTTLAHCVPYFPDLLTVVYVAARASCTTGCLFREPNDTGRTRILANMTKGPEQHIRR